MVEIQALDEVYRALGYPMLYTDEGQVNARVVVPGPVIAISAYLEGGVGGLVQLTLVRQSQTLSEGYPPLSALDRRMLAEH